LNMLDVKKYLCSCDQRERYYNVKKGLYPRCVYFISLRANTYVTNLIT
jgi:hypothetical protein